jgi:alpha-tubulin suppressor-like RCC1 family protein
MVGRRCGNGVVFTWGIANDGRLGYSIPQSQELIPMKPQIVRFLDQAVAIAKVSCGNTFTLALSSQGIVYSWG